MAAGMDAAIRAGADRDCLSAPARSFFALPTPEGVRNVVNSVYYRLGLERKGEIGPAPP